MSTEECTTLGALREAALAFREAREWAQFHAPKDLALALGIEAGELAKLFLWKSEAEIEAFVASKEGHRRVSEELADVLIYQIYLSEGAGVDLAKAVEAKLELNVRKYPVEQAHGSIRKYTQLREEG